MSPLEDDYKMEMPPFLIKAFLYRIRVITKKGCWICKNSTDDYTQIRFAGVAFTAHVLSAVAFLGLKLTENFNVPDDINVCHKNLCHNKACFNPDHIYVGTYYTNAHDKKGEDGEAIAKRIFELRKQEINAMEAFLNTLKETVE